MTIHSDARLYAGTFAKGERAELSIPAGRHAWVHVARGRVKVNGQALGEGDGAAISEEKTVTLEGIDGSEALVFDLA